MKKHLFYIWLILMTLTLISGILAGIERQWAAYIILLLATIKFNLVAFEFMGVREAHPFWKAFVIVFSSLFMLIYFVLLG